MCGRLVRLLRYPRTNMSNSDDTRESEQENAKPGDPLRDYNEGERPLLRVRAQRALTELKERIESEENDAKRKEVGLAIAHLERIVDCMADEPMPGITSDAMENEEWFYYDDFRFHYSVTGSMPMLVAAFVALVDSGVAPGRWILEPLAEAFDEILKSRDPDLAASKLGLQARGSGSSSPLKSFERRIERTAVYFDMRTLIEDFNLSRRKAAEAAIEKYELDNSAKTLSNQYEPRVKYPGLVRELLDKYSDGLGGPVVWLTKEARDEVLDSFPSSADRFLKEIRPAKT